MIPGDKVVDTDLRDYLITKFMDLMKSAACNINVWKAGTNALFKKGNYKDIQGPHLGGKSGYVYTRFTASTDFPIIPEADVRAQYEAYLNECLQAYPIKENGITFKSLLWIFNCSVIFVTTKLKGVKSSLIPNESAVIYDMNATVNVPSINNDEVIENPYYDPESEDPLINCFNESLLQSLDDQFIENYSSKANLEALLSNFTSNLKNTINTISMGYSTSTYSCSCCSSSCCSSSWFLAYTCV